MHTKSIIAATIGVAGIANALPAIKRAEQAEQHWGGGGPGSNLGEAIGDIVDASINHGHDDDDFYGGRLNRYGGGRCDPRWDDCGDPRWGSRYNDYDDDDVYWKRDAQADSSQLRSYRPQQNDDQQWDSQQTGGRQWDPTQNRRPQQDGDDCQAQCIQYCQTFLNDEAPQCAQQCPASCNNINSQSIVDPDGHASSDEAFCAIFDQYSEDGDMSTNQFGGRQNGFSQFQSIQGGGQGSRQSLTSNQVQDQNQDEDEDSNQKRDLPMLGSLFGLGGGARQDQENEQYVDNHELNSGDGYKSSGYRTSDYGTNGVNNLENNQVQSSQGGGMLNPLSSLTSVGGGLTDGLIKKRQIPGLNLPNGIGGGGMQNQVSKQSVDNEGFGMNSLDNNQVQSSQGGGLLSPLSSLTSVGGGVGSGIIKRQGGIVGNPLSILGGGNQNQRQTQQQNNRQNAGDDSELENSQLADQDVDSTQLDSNDEDENDFGTQRLQASQYGSGSGSQGGIGRQFTGGPNRGLNNGGRTSDAQSGQFRTSPVGRGGVVGGTPQNSRCPLWVNRQQSQRPAPFKA